MATTTALIYGTIFSGESTIYLAGGSASQTPYNGSGTPWDTQSTSPFELSLNDRTPIWTPTAAPAQTLWGGGPFFRTGAELVMKGWNNVTEQLGIQMRATSHDNAAALLRLLRQALSRATFDVPARLVFQPDGASQNVYYSIYDASIQESVDYITEGRSGNYLLRATITWTRSPFGSTVGAGTSAMSSASFANLGTGATDNLVPFSAPTGDMVYEGSPCNITFDPVGTAAVIWLSSVYNRTYSTTGSGNKTTSSTTGASATLNTPTVDVAVSNSALHGRCLVRLTNATTSNAQLRLEVRITSSGALIHTSPWVSPTSGIATVVDLGDVPLDVVRNASGAASTITLGIGYRSTNGASSTIGVASNDFLLYYEFCKVLATIAASSPVLAVITIPEIGDKPNINDRGTSIITTSGGTLVDFGELRGQPPKVRQGASLYIAWLQSGDVHDSTDTASVSARYGPQFFSLRGNG